MSSDIGAISGGWSLTHDFLRCLRLHLALTLRPLPSPRSSSFSPTHGEASPPGLVLGLLPASAQNTSTLSTLRPLPCAPTCSKSSWIHSSQGRRAFPRDLSKEEEDETIPATSRPSPSPRGQNPHSLPTASPDDTATPGKLAWILSVALKLGAWGLWESWGSQPSPHPLHEDRPRGSP